MDLNSSIWQGKRVLVTGHTGFKGSWLTLLLNCLGAKIIGLSLAPGEGDRLLYNDAGINKYVCEEYFIDIREEVKVDKIIKNANLDYAFHLAAQSIVNRSFKNPLETLATNFLGTANVLLPLLSIKSLKGVTVVTSDKVYENLEKKISFNESDKLGGKDPYSASKAAVELMTYSLASTCNPFSIPVTTVRAGNVIGGGDWGEDRLVPDIVKSVINSKTLYIRKPLSVRPWQYILDCITGYILIGQLHIDKKVINPTAINFGPNGSLSVIELIRAFQMYFKKKIDYKILKSNFYESNFLELDSTLARNLLNWQPNYSLQESINKTADWYAKFIDGEDSQKLMLQEISMYLESKS